MSCAKCTSATPRKENSRVGDETFWRMRTNTGNAMSETFKQRLREQAVKALLCSRSIAAAAKKVRLSERTLRRWLDDEEFYAEYQAAKRDLLRSGLANLSRKLFLASEVLGKVASHPGRPYQAARTHAASSIFRISLDADILENIEARLRQLERQSDEISVS